LRFRGGPVLTLDAKGRLTVPARWRDQLMEAAKGQLVLTRDPAGCLGLYPPAAFAQLEEVVMKLPKDHERWRRIYLGQVSEVEIDSASRILVPPELRQAAGLEINKPVLFMGVGAYFELWETARYEAHAAQAIAEGQPEALRTLVIQ
jgi:MraZ protein